MTAQTDPRVVRSRAAEVAGVSKRTVYNNFVDKEKLFREVVMAATGIVEAFTAEFAAGLAEAEADDVPAALSALARRLAATVIDPRVMRLRRLLIGEAHRFPDLAADYYRAAPGRVISMLAGAFASGVLGRRLQPPDARRAAEHFAFLVIGAGLDRAMFDGRDEAPNERILLRAADDGVRVFLDAYGPPHRPDG